MKLDVVKTAVTSKVGRYILVGKKHSPTMLFAGGVVGVVGATVLACRATLKLEEVLTDAEHSANAVRELRHDDYTEEDRTKDQFLIKAQTAGKILKLYAPAIAVGAVSITALTGSHVTLTRRNAAVMAAYSALDKGFNEYRQRVREELGEEKDAEFRYGVEPYEYTEETKDGPKTVTGFGPSRVPSIYARFFDELSPNWQRNADYNRFFLNCQQNYANDILRARGHLFLNEVYDMLGLSHTKEGAVVGWLISKEGDNFVDFGVYAGDSPEGRAFVNGHERSILLDFNVDGVIYDKI